MNRFLTLSLSALCIAFGASAQTIFQEDFETANTGDTPLPIGTKAWTTVSGYSGKNQNYTWHNEFFEKEKNPFGSDHYAQVSGPLFSSDVDGFGPREEILLSPEINLDDTYQLNFAFQISPVHEYDDSRYDFQVRVVTDDNLDGAENIFTVHDENVLRNANVPYPLPGWGPHYATVDLSDFKGEKVKLAFVFKMYKELANSVSLDDISVVKYVPPTGPVPQLTLNRFDFGKYYIGELAISDVITLKNIGKDGLQITGIDAPQGVVTTLDAAKVNLLRNQSVDFRIRYKAEMTTPANGNITIHTTGGDAVIAFQAEKEFVPEGYSLETFEEFFPPAGWESKGWGYGASPVEGDRAACGDGDYSAISLRSPMLDLSNGGSVTFTYYNLFTSDDPEDAPEYDITLQVSYDGGASWTDKWTSDYMSHLNAVFTETIDLGVGTGEDYIRWTYPAVEVDDEGAAPHSSFYLDRVLLPNVVGVGGLPGRTTLLSPANGEEDIFPQNVELSWGPAQFATGYKLYVGTSKDANEVINGEDVGRQYRYTIPQLDYETEYTWRVVAYNDKGDAVTNTTWRFKTQKDASVTEYPYEENFHGVKTVPTGWVSTTDSPYGALRHWSPNTYYEYEFDNKKFGVLHSSWLDAGQYNDLTTADFILPEDRNMAISFMWSDSHPSDLSIDPTGNIKKENVDEYDKMYGEFLILPEGGEWTKLSEIHTAFQGNENWWYTEKIDLTPYRGQKVRFRWYHKSLGSGDDGMCVTHIVIDENKDYVAGTNYSSWNAGKVNYEKSADSADRFVIFNQGNKPLTVASAEFSTPNFSSTLKAGDVVSLEESFPFTVRFDALQSAAKVSDKLVITFEDGSSIEVPVEGEALPEGTYYYSFEPNENEYQWTDDFTMIDADNATNFMFTTSWVGYSANGRKSAFTCESDSSDGEGMYGMMNPVSGMHALVSASPQSTKADNWLIYKRITVNANSSLDFYARNYDCTGTYEPDPNHRFQIMVSEAGNTNVKDFTEFSDLVEIPLAEYLLWNSYSYDLSPLAGKSVYVAIRHTTDAPSNLAFWDDIQFNNVSFAESSVEGIDADELAASYVEVYNAAGLKVAAGQGAETISALPAGFYIVRCGDRALRIMK